MLTRRYAITHDAIIKANKAMINGESVDFSIMPSSIATIIQQNKPSASDIRRAFSHARRSVEETICDI
jgi:hypothetical protein